MSRASVPKAPPVPARSPLAERLCPLLAPSLDELGGGADEVSLSMKLLWRLQVPRPQAAQILEAVHELEARGELRRQGDRLHLPPPVPRLYSLFDES